MKKRVIILLATLALCTFAACEIKVERTIVPPTETTDPLRPEGNPPEENPQGEENEGEANDGTDDESKEPSDEKPNVVPPITDGGSFDVGENNNN